MPAASSHTLSPTDILSAGSSMQKAIEAMRRHLGMAVAMSRSLWATSRCFGPWMLPALKQ